MVYENYNEKQEVEKIEKLIKQQRAKSEIKKAKTQNSDAKFNQWKKKQKSGGTEYDKKVRKMLRNE